MSTLPAPQVFTSYIDLLYPTEDRNDRLRDSYFFTCECQECTTKDKVSSRERFYRRGASQRCVSGPLCQTSIPCASGRPRPPCF